MLNQSKCLQKAFETAPQTTTKRSLADLLGVTTETASRSIHGKMELRVEQALAAFNFFGHGDLNEL